MPPRDRGHETGHGGRVCLDSDGVSFREGRVRSRGRRAASSAVYVQDLFCGWPHQLHQISRGLAESANHAVATELSQVQQDFIRYPGLVGFPQAQGERFDHPVSANL
jgi:hypothetical protein